MHNKLFIADGAMAIAGGRNIADEYFMRSMSDNFVDMDALIVGAVVPQLAAIFDVYWNSPQVYPVEAILGAGKSRDELQREFDALVDEGEQMMAASVPPVDVLGYGPIREDLDAGRLGLVWGTANAYADSPAKVTATSDEMARSMSVSMNVMDLVMASKDEVDAFIALLHSGADGGPGVHRSRQAQGQSHDPHQFARVQRRAARPYRLLALPRGAPEVRSRSLRALSEPHPESNALGLPGMSIGRLHAKTAVIDRRIVFIGSMNLDPRSASKNTELGIIADCPPLAKEVIRVIHISKLQSAYRLRFGAGRAEPAVADDGRRRRSRPAGGTRGDAVPAAAERAARPLRARAAALKDAATRYPADGPARPVQARAMTPTTIAASSRIQPMQAR